MTELEKMQRAKMYIDKMANGINPIDNTTAGETDIINNIRISRCLFYVSDVLRQVIENNGVISKTKSKKSQFFLSDESISKFAFSSTPIPISEVAKRLNNLADLEVCNKIKYSSITSWLISINALETRETTDGKSIKRPTQRGQELGITTETRTGMNGDYIVVVYNNKAQQFIIDNLEAIIANSDNKSDIDAENQWQPWTPAHDECLIDLFNKNVPASEIAVTLKRTDRGIRARLKKLGLINKRGDIK